MDLQAFAMTPPPQPQPAASKPVLNAAAAVNRRKAARRMAIPTRYIVTSARQLSVLVKTGIPLVQSIKILADQTEHAGFKQVLSGVQRDIEGGSNFSEALSHYPNAFSELYVSSVAAAEVGGVLDKVLIRLAEMMERDQEIASDVQAALRYPVLVVVAILVAVIVLMVFVIPRFASIYARFQTDLPLPTKIMILGSNILLKGWMFVVPGTIGLAFGIRSFLRTRLGRFQWDHLKLRLPIFGSLFLKIAMNRFGSMLALLYGNGVPVLRALEVVSRAVGNVAIGRQIGAVAKSVKEGKGLSGGLERASYFTPLIRHMVAVGEVTGSLQEVLDNVVTYYEMEVKNAIKNLTTLIEPILTAVLGTVVLGLALAIYLPLWNLMALFKH
ncbi:MAG: type II secretion system F family protein [Candidatus Omnitrophica bacterium]|nr:type II secretion system F family protein [Candidatus Omnitrophota bacterium]